MTIEAASKENDNSKHCVNYFQDWHMGITNKLLRKALWKQTHSSRQNEWLSLSIITQWVKTAWD